MPLIRHEFPSRLTCRRCLSCGYDGQELQGPLGALTFNCPACDEDLYARPPRSYAELEGLDEPPGAQTSLFGSRSGSLTQRRRDAAWTGPRRLFAGLWRLVWRWARRD